MVRVAGFGFQKKSLKIKGLKMDVYHIFDGSDIIVMNEI